VPSQEAIRKVLRLYRTVVSNQDSFDACYRVLEEGKTLVIFPEGTSFLERHLRELKSGTARIGLEVEKRNQINQKKLAK
jgi:1-acyl-sn-glycerol-3-phosphate acyltransferase